MERAMRPTSLPDTPRLELDGIGCRFGGVRALDGVSLAVAPGEVVGLLGDSGCGKSTLLRVVAGLETPDRGSLRLDGRTVGAGVPPEARNVGMMFQDYALFPHLTVAEKLPGHGIDEPGFLQPPRPMSAIGG